MVQGESLVGGGVALAERMEDWGYRDKAGGLLVDAVTLYQATYKAEIDAYARKIHGRDSQPDGDIGPATALVIHSRFCNVPDFANAEEARWPDKCVNEISVSWNFDKLPGTTAAETTATWDSLSTYEELFDLRMPRRPGDYPNTRIYAALKALPGSTLAWSFLANNSCGFKAQQAYDSTVSWSSKVLRTGTIRHEVGHALGMRHTPQDRSSVMYPSMRGQWELNATDIRQLERLGYKRRTAPIPPPPNPEGPVVSVIVKVDDKTFEFETKNGGGNGGWWT